MSEDIRVPTHPGCFVCDPNNPDGMKAEWFGKPDRQSIYGSLVIADTYVGPPAHVHGGASAAILDDIMGTCAWFAGHMVMTAKMTVNYRMPVPLGILLDVSARVEKVEGRKVFVTGKIKTPNGRTVVESDGLFVMFPEAFVNDAAGRFDGMKEYVKDVRGAGK